MSQTTGGSTGGGLSGTTGAIVAAGVGVVVAIVAAFGITSAVTGNSGQSDQPLVDYGSSSSASPAN